MEFNLNETVIRALPNKLTLFRIIASPFILILYPLGWGPVDVLCALIFASAGATDYFDGYIARKYNVHSKFGSLLDPIADKVLVSSAIIVLAGRAVAPVWMLGLLLIREIVISGMRLIAASNNYDIPVNKFGKAKTLMQMVALFCLMVNDDDFFGLNFVTTGMYFLILALVLSLYSAYTYIRDFWPKFNERHQVDQF